MCYYYLFQIQALSAAICPDAVGLVDAFNYNDVVLGSIVGAADGDIYTRYAVTVVGFWY